jgi:succinate dehydrogenase/fumarate reductase flavoprotein subunit
MPTNLPGTDVVVIGLGAAGGVAVLPLAEAGMDVVGL